MSKTVAAYTLGCKVNQYETEAVLEQFFARGYQSADFSEKADIYLINTCTVTSLGDRKSRQMIRRVKHLNPDSLLIVMGCYAQVAPDEVLAIPEVDLVLGTNRRTQVAELAEAFFADRRRCSYVEDISKLHCFEDLSITHYENRTRAFLKVQDGCNQFCSYCIIPYARGRIRSRALESAVSEAKRLSLHGFREIVLVGIHLASYGKEHGKYGLLELILALAEIDGIERIRLGSLEPTLFSEEFTAQLASIPKLCHHFHLSLQSGCDATLARMNRKYTTAEYAEVLARIRRVMPDAAIATDIMVGFPGETEAEFETTCRFAEQIALADAHIFQYSVRKGTVAEKMPNQVDPQVKEARSHALSAITQKSRKAFSERFLGQEMPVLFEQYHHADTQCYEGKTENYLTVIVPGNDELEGKIRRVKLLRMENGVIRGVLCDEKERFCHEENHPEAIL